MPDCGFAEFFYRYLSLSFKARCVPQIEEGLCLAGCDVVAQAQGLSSFMIWSRLVKLLECGCAEVFYRSLSLSFKAQCLPQIEQGQGFPQVSRQLFGNFLYFERLFSFRATYCILSNIDSPVIF